MQQNDLNRAVARATGETITTIKQLGFLLDEPPDLLDDDICVIDWDELENQRYCDQEALPIFQAVGS